MSLPKIALVMSTTRATRFCDKPTQWIEELARERGDMEVWQKGKDIRELTYLAANVKAMFDELMWWTEALRHARQEPLRRAA